MNGTASLRPVWAQSGHQSCVDQYAMTDCRAPRHIAAVTVTAIDVSRPTNAHARAGTIISVCRVCDRGRIGRVRITSSVAVTDAITHVLPASTSGDHPPSEALRSLSAAARVARPGRANRK